jgi:hypothetical protein
LVINVERANDDHSDACRGSRRLRSDQRRIFGASRQAGHRKEQTTAKIYQRNTLEAHRRNAAMRQNFRAGNKE